VLLEEEESAAPEILLISDSDKDCINIKEVFDRADIGWTEIGFRDDVTKLLPGAYSAIFLVSRQPDEQAFGVAIKVSSRCSLPLIVASSKWTQSSVFQAVRYGVSDILLTPASSDDVLEKLKMIINKQAA
jgi:DNA-binding NtrC family response regulator